MSGVDDEAVILAALTQTAPDRGAREAAIAALGRIVERGAREEPRADEAATPNVEVLQRFLRDGQDRAWENFSRLDDIHSLMRDLDQVISDALDNEAGWTCNQ